MIVRSAGEQSAQSRSQFSQILDLVLPFVVVMLEKIGGEDEGT
jgi:hypothetical protein